MIEDIPEDIESRRRMQKAYNYFNTSRFKNAEEYKMCREELKMCGFISAEDQFEATILTFNQPLFIPYAKKIMSENRKFPARQSLVDIVFQERGFKSLPKVINDASYNNLEGLTLYRGFKSVNEIKQFISGGFYISKCRPGSGVYFTTEKEYAAEYTRCLDGLILECKIIEQDCKIIDNKIIVEAMTVDTDKGNFNLFYDAGIYGAIKGFDVINRIEGGNPTKLILNRGKVIISEKEKNKS